MVQIGNDYYEDIVDVFINAIAGEHGCFPNQLDKRTLAEEVATFVHGIERTLIDRYELDK